MSFSSGNLSGTLGLGLGLALSGQKALSAEFSTLHHLVGEVSRISSNLCSVAGKPSRMLATYKFRSSLRRTSVFAGDFLSGALESVSAMIKSFPGMWQMLNEYFINLILNLCILGGSSSKFFKPNSGTNGLCMVCLDEDVFSQDEVVKFLARPSRRKCFFFNLSVSLLSASRGS